MAYHAILLKLVATVSLVATLSLTAALPVPILNNTELGPLTNSDEPVAPVIDTGFIQLQSQLIARAAQTFPVTSNENLVQPSPTQDSVVPSQGITQNTILAIGVASSLFILLLGAFYILRHWNPRSRQLHGQPLGPWQLALVPTTDSNTQITAKTSPTPPPPIYNPHIPTKFNAHIASRAG